MTLRNKLAQIIYSTINYYNSNLTKEIEDVADNYAMDFARFVGNHIYSYYENDTWSNDLEKKYLTTKELLEIFKKEKGL